MLQLVDTAIGFSIVMLMLSLLITAVVQTISAVLDLRGRNLAKHIEMLLNQVYPDFRKTLTALYEKERSVASLATDRKGIVLPEPGAKEKDKKAGTIIADAVVNHPVLAQGATGVVWMTRRAKAISSGELVAVLKDLASDDSTAILEGNAKRALQKCIDQYVDPTGEEAALVSALEDTLNKQDSQIAGNLKILISRAAAKASRLEQGVEQWFDTVMSRSSDLFQRYTRAITIAAAVLIAFFFQIDARQIAQQLYTNAEIRNSFVKMADDATARADKVLENTSRGTKAAQRLAQKEQDEAQKSKKALEEATPGSAAAKKAEAEMGAHQMAATLLGAVPSNVGNCGSVDTWLAAQQGTSDGLRNMLQQTCQDVTRDAMGTLGSQIKEISEKLQQSDLRIMSWGQSYWGSYANFHHMLGILATIVLLSLGAPFWFNMLRQVANLKPTIAAKLAQQESEEEIPVGTKVTKLTTKARKAAA